MTDRLIKDFGTGGWGIDHISVSRNHEHNERPETAINISAWKRGVPTSNVQLSRDEALDLAEHLTVIVASFDALKPREKTVTEKIAELPVGSVFSRAKGEFAKYTKRPDGKIHSLSVGYAYPLRDFSGWTEMHVDYDPSK